MNIQQTMTRLWVQHVIWTRQVIVSTLAHLPDASAALSRLLRNQQDIGAALGVRYGSTFGSAAAKLLTEHITISLEVVAAAASHNAQAGAVFYARWQKNATDIANALASVNPLWPATTMQKMLFDHLALTRQEAVARIEGRWGDDIVAFDEVLDQALMMAEVFAKGIA